MVLLGRLLKGIVLFVFLSAVVWDTAEARNRDAARRAFRKAQEFHEGLSRKNPSLEELRQAVFFYRKVLDNDPSYSGCDDALFAMAGLYEQMASQSPAEEHKRRAIYYYQFLATQYPSSPLRSAAVERAEWLIASRSLQNKPETAKAQSELAGRETNEYATVSEIRYWSSDEYTRVVIQLDREVAFKKEVLENPYRIYFDLEQARLTPSLEGKTYKVNDLFIKQIRVGEPRELLVRVVLDFERINKHTVFALYDPFRIVIDTRGKPSAAMKVPQDQKAKTAKAVLPPSTQVGPAPEESLPSAAPAPASPNLNGQRSLTRTLGLKIGKVVLDPGHGGHDTGTIGPTGLREKDLVLDVSLRLRDLLQTQLGMEVIMTRRSDRFIPLEERTAIANQEKADLFISIHANSSPVARVSGVETFFLNFASNADEREVASRENAGSQKNIRELEDLLRKIALGDFIEESRDLAHVVQNSLFTEMRQGRPSVRNRGVKRAPFIVLIGSNMPSILAEVGFLSNPSDEEYYKTTAARDRIAEALFKGVELYFRSLGAVPSYERVTKQP